MSNLRFEVAIDAEALAIQLAEGLTREEQFELIKELDELAADWDFTKELIDHFGALEKERKAEIAAEKRMNRK